MMHRLFTFAAGLSLPVCVAAVAIGVRSFWVADGLNLPGRDLGNNGIESRSLFSARGTLGYRVWWFDMCEVPGDPLAAGGAGTDYGVTYFYQYSAPSPSIWFRSDPAQLLSPLALPGATSQPGKRNMDVSALGFVLRRTDTLNSFVPRPYPQMTSHQADRIVGIPHWLVALAGAIAPVAWLRRTRWRGRIAKGLCPKCGYDLRATLDRCPECGTPAKKTAEAST